LPTVQQLYDQWHADRFAQYGEVTPGAPWHLMARKHIPEGSLRGKTVLEAGCGFGQFALWLAEQGGDVTAGDLSGEACRIARGLCGDRVNIDQFDVQNLVEPLGRDRFDLVCCLETLEHVPDPDLALRELVAVTKPGGRIIVSTPNYLSLVGLYRAALRMLYTLRLAKAPFTEYGQPHNNVMVGFMRTIKLKRLGCRIDAVEGTIHHLPIPGQSRQIEFPFMERHAFRYVARHVLVAATKR
jgi:2-polyprenyl-3-methyl-5-hydroxy-6-metoxy-1,4-benzoquinol methylase